MNDFQVQQGVVNFQLPTVVPAFLTQINTINAGIVAAATASQFLYVASVPVYLPDDSIPGLVYDLTAHFTKRGFQTLYDGVGGTLTISWDHPEMSDGLMSDITYASPTLLSSMGGWFSAGVIYLCMTSGVDLRSSGSIVTKRTIQKSIERMALMGLTTTTWGYPNVPPAVLSNLYSDVFTNLNYNGFGVSYNTVTGLFVIAWDDGTMNPVLKDASTLTVVI